MKDKVKGTKADMPSDWAGVSGYHHFIKKQKRRIERRRAKQNPECEPAYNKFKGWES